MVQARETMSRATRSKAELFWPERVTATHSLAEEGLDLSRRSTRVVSMVLPLLHGTPLCRRRAANQKMARSATSGCAIEEELSSTRSGLPATTEAGAPALGVRLTQDLSRPPLRSHLLECGIYQLVKDLIHAFRRMRHALVEPPLQ